MVTEKRVRRGKLTKMFSLQDALPAHYRLCIFNILLVILIFEIVLNIELIYDIPQMKKYTSTRKAVIQWYLPLNLQQIAIALFSFLGCLYFITSYLWPSNIYCFKSGTVFIAGSLAFFFSTIIWSPWYFVCFFVTHKQWKEIEELTPTLFYLMICLLILSIFNIGFVAWVITHIVLQRVLEMCGVKKLAKDLMHPIKMVNDDKRTVEISSSHHESLDKDESIEVEGELSVAIHVDNNPDVV
ncbi:Transmembrane_domain-containing protein [Hexamita inflata]|uniref:Transmembrane domain-containing protein n=1 Tax=Hexamita inflata TaxID=28002 RepID=A0AA86NC26_9EUKA|nr:Transmembrane domain-containing protein [Hexamita inflata]